MKKLVSVENESGQQEFVAIAKIIRIVAWPSFRMTESGELIPRTGILGAGDSVICVSSETPEVIAERIENAG